MTRARFLFQFSKFDHDYERQWKDLLRVAFGRATELRFAMNERGPSIIGIEKKWPFLKSRPGPGADQIIEELAGRLGAPKRCYTATERWGSEQQFVSVFAHYDLTDGVREYLLTAVPVPMAWDQGQGFPEDPSLLRDGEAVLETISHEAYVIVTWPAAGRNALFASGIPLRELSDGDSAPGAG